MDLNNKRKVDQNRSKLIKTNDSENFFPLLDGVESDLEDDIDELMNDSETEFVFEKEDSEKGDVSDYQPNILIPEANIHVIKDRGENPEDSEEESQEYRADVPEAKEKPKGQSKEKEKGKGMEKGKGKERELRRWKFP